MNQDEFFAFRKERGQIVGKLIYIAEDVFHSFYEGKNTVRIMDEYLFNKIKFGLRCISSWSDFLISVNFPGICGEKSARELSDLHSEYEKLIDTDNLTHRDFQRLSNELTDLFLRPFPKKSDPDDDGYKALHFFPMINKDLMEINWAMDTMFRSTQKELRDGNSVPSEPDQSSGVEGVSPPAGEAA